MIQTTTTSDTVIVRFEDLVPIPEKPEAIDGKYHTVYRTTNRINQHFYVGVHITGDPFDSYLGSGKILLAAITKYGIKNFYKEILVYSSSEEEAYRTEATIVTKEFIKRADVYNIKEGGFGGYPELTYEQRSARSKKANETKGPEGRSLAAKRGNETKGPEGRSLAAKRGKETLGSEGRSLAVKKANESRGVEGRSLAAKKAKETLGSEGRSSAVKKGHVTKGPEGRSLAAKKANETRGLEGRSLAAKKRLETMGPEGRSLATKRAKETLGPEGRSLAAKRANESRGPEGRSLAAKRGNETRKRMKLELQNVNNQEGNSEAEWRMGQTPPKVGETNVLETSTC